MSSQKSERDQLVSLLTSGNQNNDLSSVRTVNKKLLIGFLSIGFLLIVFVAWAAINKARSLEVSTDKKSLVNHQTEEIKFDKPLPSGKSAVVDDNSALNAAGFIVARRLATASSEVMGVLKTVDVDEGMHVKEGDVLATVNSSVLNQDIALATDEKKLAMLQYQRLNAELIETEKQYKRLGVLQKNNLVAIQEYETEALKQNVLQLRVQEAEVQMGLASTRLDRLREELEKYTIRAPFSGVVIGKNAQAGEIVSPSSAGGGFTRTGICTIVDMSSLEIEVDINERFLQKINVNQRVTANLDAYPAWDISGSVIAVIPAANRSKGTVRVRIKLLEQDPRIIPDMSLRVSFGK